MLINAQRRNLSIMMEVKNDFEKNAHKKTHNYCGFFYDY